MRHGIAGRGPDSWLRTWTGGSVERWAVKASVPPTQARTATPMPATGCQAVASTVTRIGPIMKTASSATDSSA